MEFKGTKGPWTHIQGVWHDTVESNEITICAIRQPWRSIAEHDANAKLIAASPDILEALQEAKQQIEYLHNKFKATGSGNAVLSRIDSALTKALE